MKTPFFIKVMTMQTPETIFGIIMLIIGIILYLLIRRDTKLVYGAKES